MSADELATALDWLVRSAVLALALFAWHRARRHAREAKAAAEQARAACQTAWLHSGNALVAEERLNAMLPPDVLPMPATYRDDKEHVPPGVPCGGFPEGRPASPPPPEDEPPAVLPFPFHARRGPSPRRGGAS